MKITRTMNIIEIKTLRGPNYWSNYRKKLIRKEKCNITILKDKIQKSPHCFVLLYEKQKSL